VWTEPILHVDMDAFFVAVERLRDPTLVGRPVVVGGTGPRSVVAAASYEVRSFGIRSAMPMSRARRLCPDLMIVPPDHAEYGRVSEKVFAVFRSFTPLVEGLSIDEAFLDIGGLRLHHDSPVAVGEAVRSAISDHIGMTASVGVATNKFLAKLASETAKPDGLRHVPLAEQQSFLDGLPIESLWGVGQATHAALETVGVERVADLRAVPQRMLERAVGVASARHLVDLAHGRDSRPVQPDRDAKSFSVEETYSRDIVDGTAIDTELRRLADRLGSRLRRAGVAGRTVTLKLRFSDFRTVTRSTTRPGAVDGDRELFHTARELLASLEVTGRPVRLLGLGVSQITESSDPMQLDVASDGRWTEVDATVDAIRRRFGQSAVGPARLLGPSDPE
jgi:DNA polymerase IV